MKQSKFEIFKSDDGWRFRLRASNGEIVCQSEGYTTKRGAVRGAAACKRNATGAVVLTLH